MLNFEKEFKYFYIYYYCDKSYDINIIKEFLIIIISMGLYMRNFL